MSITNPIFSSQDDAVNNWIISANCPILLRRNIETVSPTDVRGQHYCIKANTFHEFLCPLHLSEANPIQFCEDVFINCNGFTDGPPGCGESTALWGLIASNHAYISSFTTRVHQRHLGSQGWESSSAGSPPIISLHLKGENLFSPINSAIHNGNQILHVKSKSEEDNLSWKMNTNSVQNRPTDYLRTRQSKIRKRFCAQQMYLKKTHLWNSMSDRRKETDCVKVLMAEQIAGKKRESAKGPCTLLKRKHFYNVLTMECFGLRGPEETLDSACGHISSWLKRYRQFCTLSWHIIFIPY